jgi:hypothetical protein
MEKNLCPVAYYYSYHCAHFYISLQLVMPVLPILLPWRRPAGGRPQYSQRLYDDDDDDAVLLNNEELVGLRRDQWDQMWTFICK